MLIYNWAAIGVAIVIAIVVVPIILIGNWISPGAMDGNWSIAICALIGTLISAVCEAAGLRGRLFFLPMWLIGLGVAGYALFEELGWIGPVGALVAAGLMFGGLMYWSKVSEESSWAEAPAALQAAQASAQIGHHADAWKQLENALFVPGMLDATQEMWGQMRQVLALVYQLTGGQVDPEVSQQLAQLDAQLAAALGPNPQVAADKVELDDDHVEALRDLITQTLEKYEEAAEPAAAS